MVMTEELKIIILWDLWGCAHELNCFEVFMQFLVQSGLLFVGYCAYSHLCGRETLMKTTGLGVGFQW